METLADVLARDRRSDAPALFADGPTTQRYDYRRFLTTAWKTGNLLHKRGVRTGAEVAIVPSPRAQPVLTFLGASLLGAVTTFDPPKAVEARAFVAPTDRLGEFDIAPGTATVGYGTDPENPAHDYWEGGVWSENPTMPPEPTAPSDPILDDGDRQYTHGDLVAGAEWAADELGLTAENTVVVSGRVASPAVLAAGVIAPLVAGASIRLDDGDEDAVAVAEGASVDVSPGFFDRVEASR
ncbi:AMP-binding protein [Haloarchaeobius iranensis]|uniref:AMP-binding enzyme n=1 Tax=Haloarchaeobius iranensis TaxID=996166 RepID=A0A1G9V0H9_9EURY|nr:AMP-binding protein [Haloarchaeobius iranensis]SDM65623.1 AMP-binding enzyme [Haloarchaeobius iranensis]